MEMVSGFEGDSSCHKHKVEMIGKGRHELKGNMLEIRPRQPKKKMPKPSTTFAIDMILPYD